ARAAADERPGVLVAVDAVRADAAPVPARQAPAGAGAAVAGAGGLCRAPALPRRPPGGDAAGAGGRHPLLPGPSRPAAADGAAVRLRHDPGRAGGTDAHVPADPAAAEVGAVPDEAAGDDLHGVAARAGVRGRELPGDLRRLVAVPRRVPAEDAGDVRGDGAGAGRVRGGVRPARACGEVVDRRRRRLHRGDRGPAGEPRLRGAEADGELLLPRAVAALAEPRPEAVAGVVDPAE